MLLLKRLIVLVCLLAFIIMPSNSFAQKKKVYSAEVQEFTSQVLNLFESGKYKDTIIKLDEMERELTRRKWRDQYLLGLIAYWRAISYKRLNEFPMALDNFRLAIAHRHKARDLYYEYGQTLYTSEQMDKARRAFRISAVNKKFKPAVSWYYVGFINQKDKNYKKAIDAYKKVEKVNDLEKDDIIQPAMMQLGDIYYLLSKQRVMAVETMERLVIPQYEKALKYNPDSRLGYEIRVKIREIRRVFDIVMFKMQNGRPTVYPPFFARFVQGISQDSNVVFAPDDNSTVDASDQGSIISNTEMMGKYTFYYKNKFSIAPELRASYGYHLNRDSNEVIANDNYAINFAIRNAYEYEVWKDVKNEEGKVKKKRVPRSFLFDYEYNYLALDSNAEENIKYYSSSHTFMFGKRFTFSTIGESIFRYKFKSTTNDDEDFSSTTNTFAYEQVIGVGLGKTLLFTMNYNMLSSETDKSSYNALLTRVDLILPRFRNWFTPSFALAVTFTDTLESSATRGTEVTLNPSIKIGKRVGKNSRVIFSYSYTKNSSDSEDYTYTKSVYGLDYEYVF